MSNDEPVLGDDERVLVWSYLALVVYKSDVVIVISSGRKILPAEVDVSHQFLVAAWVCDGLVDRLERLEIVLRRHILADVSVDGHSPFLFNCLLVLIGLDDSCRELARRWEDLVNSVNGSREIRTGCSSPRRVSLLHVLNGRDDLIDVHETRNGLCPTASESV
eukprot:jgi/Mesvir1/3877/Mv25855-RA.1